jgi:hypothetical protein
VKLQGRTSLDRAARRTVGGWAIAVAIAGCALSAAPAGATDGPPEVHLVPGVVIAAPPGLGDGNPGPGGPPPGAHDDDDDDARPVASRPTASAPAGPADDGLAVRALHVPARLAVAGAREDGVAVSFVPRPGCLEAEVRLVALRGGARRAVARRVVAVHGGRRAALHLRAPAGLRPGRYQVVVRAGASVRTLGAPVSALLRIG